MVLCLIWYYLYNLKNTDGGVLLLIQPWLKVALFRHVTIIGIGITWKKIPCYMRDSACRWCIVKKAKIFSSYVKHFEFLTVWETEESWLVYVNKFSWIAHQLLDWYNKTQFGKKRSTRCLKDVLSRQARRLAKGSCRCPKDVLNANLKVIFVKYLQ